MRVVYHAGGYDERQPLGNLAERWDEGSATFTRFDADGKVIESRPLTAEEIASLTPAPPVPVPSADALDLAADKAERSLIADVRDLAADLRAAADALRGA